MCPPQAQGKHYKALLQLIRSRQDPKAALEAALAVVEGFDAAPEACTEAASTSDEPPPPMLDQYPRCKQLLDTLRRSPNNHNKTPVAVLHEYATRFHRQVVYTELSKSSVGPFTVEARLMSITQEHTFAAATSQVCAPSHTVVAVHRKKFAQGRAKKDAKQAAAAAILEELLHFMPEMAFLVPGKSTKPRLVRAGVCEPHHRLQTTSLQPQPFGSGRSRTTAPPRTGHTLDLIAGQLPQLQAQDMSSALFGNPAQGLGALSQSQFVRPPPPGMPPVSMAMPLHPGPPLSPIQMQQSFDQPGLMSNDTQLPVR